MRGVSLSKAKYMEAQGSDKSHNRPFSKHRDLKGSSFQSCYALVCLVGLGEGCLIHLAQRNNKNLQKQTFNCTLLEH